MERIVVGCGKFWGQMSEMAMRWSFYMSDDVAFWKVGEVSRRARPGMGKTNNNKNK